MANTLPMRFRILHIISQKEDINCKELIEELRPEYGNEGQLKESGIENHLASMRAVGLIEINKSFLDSADKLIQRVKITEYGQGRLSYLPKSWRNTA